MSGKEISEALSDISDEMVEQTALTREEKRSRGKMIWFRIAAMAATVVIVLTVSLWPRKTEDGYVTAPGILKVYGYDISTGTSIEDMEMRELEEVTTTTGVWSPAVSSLDGLPLRYQVDDAALNDEEITLQICVNGGEFLDDHTLEKYQYNGNLEEWEAAQKSRLLGNDFVINNGSMIEWRITTKEWLEVTEADGGLFVETVIWCEKHIIGYAVVEIVEIPDSGFYAAVILKAEYYAKIDGEYQDIADEHVRQEIANCKAEAIK